MKNAEVEVGKDNAVLLVGVVNNPLGIKCQIIENGEKRDFIVKCDELHFLAASGLLEFLHNSIDSYLNRSEKVEQGFLH